MLAMRKDSCHSPPASSGWHSSAQAEKRMDCDLGSGAANLQARGQEGREKEVQVTQRMIVAVQDMDWGATWAAGQKIFQILATSSSVSARHINPIREKVSETDCRPPAPHLANTAPMRQ